MKIELGNGLGTVYTSTQDVETTIRHNPEKLCKNCKHWERNKPRETPIYNVGNEKLDTQIESFGECHINIGAEEIGFHDRLKCNELIIHADLYSFETGENFGCIHFKGEE